MNGLEPTPTLRDLAAKLRVSVSTVSLALRNDQRVAKGTRERVIAAAGREGYHLNPAVAALMAQVRCSRRVAYRETIGWLNLWDHPDTYTKQGVEFQRFLWSGARDRAHQLGYALDSFWLAEPGMTARRMTSILSSRGIRGILIPPLPSSSDNLQLDWDRFTAVTLSYTLDRPKMDRVIPDHFGNMVTILRRLARLGYRRPGLLIPRGHDERGGHRLVAAYTFAQNALAEDDRVPVQVCHPSIVEREVVIWLKKHRPDAVITLGKLKHLKTMTGIGRAYLDRLGLVLMSLAGSDAGISGINENPAIIGAAGVEQLVLSLQRNEHGLPEHPRLIQIEGTWCDGQTTPVPRVVAGQSRGS
ncbi:MAG: LacI family transcriptional regulator [Rariglobus sp.]|nr:LacI family transcriptional regulator [Rariglobus sp.]